MKIFCVGRNYAAHALELKNEIPKEPILFMKPQTALAHNDQLLSYPKFTKNLHYECEIVLKIFKKGKEISETEAINHYQEWTVGLDFTARDLQDQCKSKGLPWEIAKAFDNSVVVGNFIKINPETRYSTQFSLEKNGQIVQNGCTSQLLFNFEKLIHVISQYFTLEVGDLIFTGTPSGVGPVLSGDQLIGRIDSQTLFDIHVQ